jgi:hypothetical protein
MGVELSFFTDSFSLISNHRKCPGSKSYNLTGFPSTLSLIRPADIAKSADPAARVNVSVDSPGARVAR